MLHSFHYFKQTKERMSHIRGCKYSSPQQWHRIHDSKAVSAYRAASKLCTFVVEPVAYTNFQGCKLNQTFLRSFPMPICRNSSRETLSPHRPTMRLTEMLSPHSHVVGVSNQRNPRWNSTIIFQIWCETFNQASLFTKSSWNRTSAITNMLFPNWIKMRGL